MLFVLHNQAKDLGLFKKTLTFTQRKTATQHLFRHRIAVRNRIFSFDELLRRVQASKHRLLTAKISFWDIPSP